MSFKETIAERRATGADAIMPLYERSESQGPELQFQLARIPRSTSTPFAKVADDGGATAGPSGYDGLCGGLRQRQPQHRGPQRTCTVLGRCSWTPERRIYLVTEGDGEVDDVIAPALAATVLPIFGRLSAAVIGWLGVRLGRELAQIPQISVQ